MSPTSISFLHSKMMMTGTGLQTFGSSKLHFHGGSSSSSSSSSSNNNLGCSPHLYTCSPKPGSGSTKLSASVQFISNSSSSSSTTFGAIKSCLDAAKHNTSTSVASCIWKWRGYCVRYQCCGDTGPALVLIHGFGANSDHWRKNIEVLGNSHRVYAIDLIGYGYSDKPNPRHFAYTFQTWASLLNDFCLEVVNDTAFFVCNSIGGLVGLQAAVSNPDLCRGILLLNISLRMLHIKNQPLLARPFIKAFQSLLRNTALGPFFFKTVATTQSVRNILSQCYHDTSQVTDELVDIILRPGLQPGAVDVFLDFISYSDGPLPQELLPQVKCPVLIGWGDKDPWEPIELGRAYGDFQSVEQFVVLPDVGHCPQDEAPQLVNPLVESFVARHSTSTTSELVV